MQIQLQQEADTVELMINMGPQHPSTHGVFRLVLGIDGERIVSVEPHIGYLHRGSEKLCEAENYTQIITLFDRLDYVGNVNSELAFCLTVEKLSTCIQSGRCRLLPPARHAPDSPNCRCPG